MLDGKHDLWYPQPMSIHKFLNPAETPAANCVGTTERKPSQFEQEAKEMEASLVGLAESVGALEADLEPVLSPPTPEKAGGEGAPEVLLAPVAELVRKWRKAVGRIEGRIRYIKDRVEV